MSEKSKKNKKPLENNKASMEKLVYMVEQCIDYQNLYALEQQFNKCGLTLQTTANKKQILCKLRDGKYIAEHVVDDFIFVGSLDEQTKELSERAVGKITDFIRTNHGDADKVQNIARVWRNGVRMYESTVNLVNEGKAEIIDKMILG